ncbi:MAG: PHP domain-containing protein [Candidatus Sumerlaeaceae bacterium]
MHSTHSDGTDTPRALVEIASQRGLAAIAVTDHDTFSAVEEAKAAGTELGVRVLSGVEISVEYAGKTVHMLGYCFDAGADTLREKLGEILKGRDERNLQIVKKLNELGMDITYNEITAEAGGKVVGRPHFAAVLLRKGYVQQRQEAFDKYLAKGAAAYMDRLRFGPEDSVAMIREAGGVAVLAHPKLVRFPDGETLDDLVRSLTDAGLGGIECYYSLHTAEETQQYLSLSRKYNLVATGGSDYHGRNKPKISMGTGEGDLHVPISCADALEARARQR